MQRRKDYNWVPINVSIAHKFRMAALVTNQWEVHDTKHICQTRKTSTNQDGPRVVKRCFVAALVGQLHSEPSITHMNCVKYTAIAKGIIIQS